MRSPRFRLKLGVNVPGTIHMVRTYADFTFIILLEVHDLLQANSYANAIPSFRFWSGRKKLCSSVQIETGVLCEIGCGDGARVICLFARVIQQSGFWTQKIQANVHYCLPCLAPRRDAPSARRSALDSSIQACAD